MKVWQKRGKWCSRDSKGMLCKFDTEAEANAFAGLETIDGSEEKEESSPEKEKKTNKSDSKKDTTSKSKKV